jgi:sterol desaturase/sphingolipid hydroxylase (fatty acid hydroxylase superfamily)
MSHLPIDMSKDPESIRLFKSDILEFFTHISSVTILILWVPVTVFLLVTAALKAPTGAFPWYLPAVFVIGLFLWTLGEYTLHRFLFHYPAKTLKVERIFFLFHGVHQATYHFPMRRGYAKYIKRCHMAHHHKNPDTRYGVSSPLWDWVFGTAGEV